MQNDEKRTPAPLLSKIHQARGSLNQQLLQPHSNLRRSTLALCRNFALFKAYIFLFSDNMLSPGISRQTKSTSHALRILRVFQTAACSEPMREPDHGTLQTDTSLPACYSKEPPCRSSSRSTTLSLVLPSLTQAVPFPPPGPPRATHANPFAPPVLYTAFMLALETIALMMRKPFFELPQWRTPLRWRCYPSSVVCSSLP